MFMTQPTRVTSYNTFLTYPCNYHLSSVDTTTTTINSTTNHYPYVSKGGEGRVWYVYRAPGRGYVVDTLWMKGSVRIVSVRIPFPLTNSSPMCACVCFAVCVRAGSGMYALAYVCDRVCVYSCMCASILLSLCTLLWLSFMLWLTCFLCHYLRDCCACWWLHMAVLFPWAYVYPIPLATDMHSLLQFVYVCVTTCVVILWINPMFNILSVAVFSVPPL